MAFLRKLASLALAACLGSSAFAAPAPAVARPNMIFIYIDDLRWDGLGCTGHPYAKTPNIDRIGREGAIFQNAFVSIPLCSPSRASFLTGQYAHTHQIIGNTPQGDAISHKMVTFPLLLQRAGYESAYIGKWHMGNDDKPRQGFDRWVSFRGQGVYQNPVLNIDGQTTRTQGYITDILTSHAVDFVRKPHDKPFVLCLGHKAVHDPFTPAERHKDLYAQGEPTRRPNSNVRLEGKPGLKMRVAARKKPNQAPNGKIERQQMRTMAAVDDGVGEILKALQESGQLDNTLIVFTSDNGFFWGEFGMGDKRAAHEESIRIPMLVRYPKLIAAGSRPEALVLNVDIAPTFLDLGQTSIPQTMHGRSMLPLFKNPNAPWRSDFLTEYFFEKRYPQTPSWQAVRSERWKYIHYPNLAGADELYDLAADPYEMKNIIQDSKQAETLTQLKARLKELLNQTGPIAATYSSDEPTSYSAAQEE